MTGPRLQAYLKLERAMLDLDAADDPLADTLRDAMDPMWYALTDEERTVLDGRDIEERERTLPTIASRVEVLHRAPRNASLPQRPSRWRRPGISRRAARHGGRVGIAGRARGRRL